MFLDDVIHQIDILADRFNRDQTYMEKKHRRQFSFVLVPASWFQAKFGTVESGIVCICSGAVEVRASSQPGISLYFEDPKLRFL